MDELVETKVRDVVNSIVYSIPNRQIQEKNPILRQINKDNDQNT